MKAVPGTRDGSGDTARQSALADMSPAYFGMVMATGIVSIGAWLLEMPLLAKALFALNIAAYGVLWLLTLLRAVRHRERFVGDLFDHLRGPGFFTTVAATGILGSEFVLLEADDRIGTALWAIAIALWIALTYTIFTGLTIKSSKPSLDRGINGAWLLAVPVDRAPRVPEPRRRGGAGR